jgi:hypothetical protein
MVYFEYLMSFIANIQIECEIGLNMMLVESEKSTGGALRGVSASGQAPTTHFGALPSQGRPRNMV